MLLGFSDVHLSSKGLVGSPKWELSPCRLKVLNTSDSYLVESPVDFTALLTCPKDIKAVAWALQGTAWLLHR